MTDKLLHVISTDYNTSLFLADNILAFDSRDKLLYLIEKMEILLNLNLASIPIMASSVFSLRGRDEITDQTVLNQQILSNDMINSDLINNSITKLHNLWYYSIPIYIEQYFDIATNLLESDVAVVQIFVPDVIVTKENVEDIMTTNDAINEFTHPDVYKSFIRLRDKFNDHPKPSFLKYNKELFETSIISH